MASERTIDVFPPHTEATDASGGDVDFRREHSGIFDRAETVYRANQRLTDEARRSAAAIASLSAERETLAGLFEHLAGAGLDVWQQEPPPLDHPLLALDNVVATFHTAGVSHEGRRDVASMAAEQVVQILDGERPPRLMNPDVWDRFVQRRNAVVTAAAAA